MSIILELKADVIFAGAYLFCHNSKSKFIRVIIWLISLVIHLFTRSIEIWYFTISAEKERFYENCSLVFLWIIMLYEILVQFKLLSNAFDDSIRCYEIKIHLIIAGALIL